MIAQRLLALSSALFAVTGTAYVLVPGLALGIVGIESSSESDFLLRTEGVALLFGAVVTWALRSAGVSAHRTGLLALAGYYVASSLVDLAAFVQEIVGPASVPSAVARMAVGIVCLGAVWSAGRSRPA